MSEEKENDREGKDFLKDLLKILLPFIGAYLIYLLFFK